MNRRTITCPRCGAEVKLPTTWIFGIEVVFRCPECKRQFKTGFKMGAVLFGLALALALGTVNILAYLLSSITLPLLALMIIPMWIFYGFVLRRAYLCRRIIRQSKRARRNSGEA